MNDKVLMNYLDEKGMLKNYPSKRKNKNIALKYLITKFEYDKKYSEKEVNDIIDNNCLFKDCAWIRRELYGLGFLGRKIDGSEYWKEKKQPTDDYLGL